MSRRFALFLGVSTLLATPALSQIASGGGGSGGITTLTGDVTATGSGSVAATVAAIGGVTVGTPTGTGNVVFSTSPTLVTPALGTPTALVGTNISGTAASLTAGTVTTDANLTGVITSSGNATSIASQTGTGTKFVVDTSPVLVTPSLGVTTVTGTGAASVAGMLWTGLPFVGTGTTSFPLLFVQPTGGTPPTASTAWNTSGTVFGANLHTGTFGNFLDFQVDGTSKASIASSGAINGVSITATGGNVQVTAGAALLWNGRGILSSPAAAKVQFGSTDAASPVAQTLLIQNVIAGTSNTAGVSGTIAGSAGTGTGTGGSLIFQTAPAGTTGTAQNAEQTALTIDQKSHIGLSSAAIPTIGTCGTGSPAVTAGSTDNAGEFTIGTTATACTLTFKQTFTAAPFCVLTDKTATVRLLSYTISTSALVLTMTSNSGDVVEYNCSGI